MIRSLHTAATGMRAQQLYVDNISNNLANVNNVGFKKSRMEFTDLLYQNITEPGENTSEHTRNPEGLQIGLGVKVAGNQKIFIQGSPQATEHEFDLMIDGKGFFQISKPDNSIGYTRNGAFKLNEEGVLVTNDGYKLEPEIAIPEHSTNLSIDAFGNVYVVPLGETQSEKIATIELAGFVNETGLKAEGKGLYAETQASGAPIVAEPGQENLGTVLQGFLEMANVMPVEEMVNMIVAQRAYEISSKAVTSADEMMQIANQLKR